MWANPCQCCSYFGPQLSSEPHRPVSKRSLLRFCSHSFQNQLNIGSTNFHFHNSAMIHYSRIPFHLCRDQRVNLLNFKGLIGLAFEVANTYLGRSPRKQYRSKMDSYTSLATQFQLDTHYQPPSHPSPRTNYSRSMSIPADNTTSCMRMGRMESAVEPCPRRLGNNTTALALAQIISTTRYRKQISAC